RRTGWFRDCSGWLALGCAALVLLGISQLTSANDDQPAPTDRLEQAITERRDGVQLDELQRDARLDAVASDYLEQLIDRRDFSPLTDPGSTGELASNIASALGNGEDDEQIAGISIGYGPGFGAAVGHASGNASHSFALLDPDLDRFGAASTVVEGESEWLAESPDDSGVTIDLRGYTLLVIVTAGSG
ncbi:MAG: hypothetical protein ACOC9Y_01240, partial [Chloroflexota bacterium]